MQKKNISKEHTGKVNIIISRETPTNKQKRVYDRSRRRDDRNKEGKEIVPCKTKLKPQKSLILSQATSLRLVFRSCPK